MKNLILVRHAKSSWETAAKDVDRPLSKRGIADAHLVASHSSCFVPKKYLMFTSIAKRALDTAVIFAQKMVYPTENIIRKKELYTFDENQLENIIKSTDNPYHTGIFFGHNEAITNFVNKFGDRFIANVPTSGWVSLEFETPHWDKIAQGKIKAIVFPKDLK